MTTAMLIDPVVHEIPTLMNKTRLLGMTHQELDSLTATELQTVVALADLPMCRNVNLSGKDRGTLTRLAHLARLAVAHRD